MGVGVLFRHYPQHRDRLVVAPLVKVVPGDQVLDPGVHGRRAGLSVARQLQPQLSQHVVILSLDIEACIAGGGSRNRGDVDLVAAPFGIDFDPAVVGPLGGDDIEVFRSAESLDEGEQDGFRARLGAGGRHHCDLQRFRGRRLIAASGNDHGSRGHDHERGSREEPGDPGARAQPVLRRRLPGDALAHGNGQAVSPSSREGLDEVGARVVGDLVQRLSQLVDRVGHDGVDHRLIPPHRLAELLARQRLRRMVCKTAEHAHLLGPELPGPARPGNPEEPRLDPEATDPQLTYRKRFDRLV